VIPAPPPEQGGVPGPLVLLVEDEAEVRRFVRESLVADGYRVLEAERGEEAIRLAAEYLPDLVVLDLGLPDLDGMEILRRLREWSAVPVVVLSARGKETQKVEALDGGADDYLTKPFGIRELRARLRVAHRNSVRIRSSNARSVFASGRLRVDLAARQVKVGDRPVRLTPTEYRILLLLIRHAGKVLTHRQILQEVWGPRGVAQAHDVRVHMANLRHKIEEDPARPALLQTETGVGYRLIEDE
jgi:two-component system KDP operon response regulator KdpE